MMWLSLIPRWAYAYIAVAVAAGGAVLWWGEHRHDQGVDATRKVYQAAIDRQKADAAKTLANEIARVQNAESDLREAKQLQELKDDKNRKTTADLSDRLRKLGSVDGRLRDPNAQTRCRNRGGDPFAKDTSPTSISADDATQTDGLLSVQLSELLRERLREADAVNDAYASCRADAYRVRW